ncbi:hypothetical protein HZA38_04185 [Candidatus Peregrinibacteria bacterium]|nr:hypothetical protein [Candidatus Peregrinibacteria bacterium]
MGDDQISVGSGASSQQGSDPSASKKVAPSVQNPAGNTPQRIVAASSQSGATSKSNANAGVVVPEETKKKFPDLVELILGSESMNTEERNYWLQVLPVMNPDQVKELRDILETEKKKLAAIDAKYAAKPQAEKKVDIEEVERKKKEEREKRKQAEITHRREEEKKAEGLLSELGNL